MFEHRFLTLINDHSFRHPPDNDRVCDHDAKLAFPQEKISHYTTVCLIMNFCNAIILMTEM